MNTTIHLLEKICPSPPAQTTTLVSSALNLLITILLGFIIVGLKSTNVLNFMRRKKGVHLEAEQAARIVKEAAEGKIDVFVQTNVQMLSEMRKMSAQNSNTHTEDINTNDSLHSDRFRGPE